MNGVLNISAGPHVRDRWTTGYIMTAVILALLPATIVGVIVNGINALLVIIVAVACAVGTEFIFNKLTHGPDSWKNGSAAVTGLLLALSLSPAVPLYIPAVGSIFAILVVKMCFGGLGKNFLNPALAGRCFALISFGKAMTMFGLDGVSSATPIAELMSGRAVNVTKMFLGTGGGVIGSSIVALLIGGLVLWAMDIIHGEICFAVLGGFTVTLGLFGGQGFDPHYLLAHLCGGGVVMGAFFMATDYATSPVSKLGQLTYGLIIGVLGALFRIFGTAADSFSYSIIIGNLFVPLIDTYVIPKPFAYRRSAIALQNGEPKLPFWKKIPKPIIALTVITLVAGIALSGVFSLTKDTIDAQKEAAAAESYRAVCPAAESFETTVAVHNKLSELNGAVYGTSFGRVYINKAVVGKDSSGNIVGYVVSATSAEGYDGNVTISLGIAPDGTVTGISFTELHETPGMGMRCDEPEFRDQFNGRLVTAFKVLKDGGGTKPEEIDSVSGATTTSKAVVNAVNAGLDFWANYMKGGE